MDDSPTARTTPELGSEVGRKRVMTLVAALLTFLIGADLVALFALERYPVNRSNWLVREKWRLLDRTSAVDLLVLGDSSCSQAVRADVLDAALDVRSLNLCTVGNMLAVNDAWMLGEYIRQHGAPKRIVIVHVYHAWNRTIDHSFAQLLGKIDRPWGFWTRMEPAVELDAELLAEAAVSRWFPLSGEHISLRRLLQSPWRGLPPRFSVDEAGFMSVTTAHPARVLRDADAHLLQLAEVSPAHVLSDDNRNALRHLRALAERHDVRITLAPAPIYAGLWDSRATRERVRLLNQALRDAVGPSTHLVVIEDPAPTFAADQMENVDHIVGEATRTYTHWLARVLARGPTR